MLLFDLKKLLAPGCLALALTASAGAADFTLNEALSLAYTSNPLLQAARAKVRAADEVVAQASGGWRPNVSVSGNWGYQRQSATATGYDFDRHSTPLNTQVTVTQQVFTGGQIYSQVARATEQVRVARADLKTVEQQVLFSTVAAYLDVVRDEANLRIHRDDVDALQRQRQATDTQLSAGAVTRPDLDQVDVRLGAARAALANAQAQLARSRAAFQRFVGRPAETLEQAPALPNVVMSYEDALMRAIHQNPQVLAAQASERAADYGVDDAVGALLPHAAIVAQYTYGRNLVYSGMQAPVRSEGLTLYGQLTIPLYSGGIEHAKVRESKEVRAQARHSAADAELAARQMLEESWATLEADNAALSLNNGRVKSSKSALAGIAEQQLQGERSIIDILNAEQEHLEAKLALESSRHDAALANFQLLAATGSLNAKTLALKVKLYDPEDHYSSDAHAWFGLGD